MGVRDAEVGDLHQALDPRALADEDVRRLHVAVHDAGTVVVVDQLRLLCQMESGDQIGLDTSPIKTARLSFIEAF